MTDTELVPSPGEPEPGGPSAWLQFSATIGDLSRSVGQLVGEHRAARAEPIQTPLKRGNAVPASGTLLLDFGGPSMGRRWSVRSIACGPASGPTGTLAGVANWYVGNPAAFGGGEWAAPTMTTLPGFQTISAEQLNVTATDHLFCVITGGTAGQAAIARAYILDFPQYVAAPNITL